ncbi:hypothetical protein H6P81_020722 [Aristolochia fimbriata]|uniref:Uncharacterized protein n=1 Tax=Aristolochia fimbriata TaxID=158543 RepID=A0AAV7DV78_ARIFI|nr:hypothetical protein H6P81_020722 [Aristolochia fimbriata]
MANKKAPEEWRERGEKKNRNIIVQAGIGLSEAPETDKWASAERMSLMKNKINALVGKPFSPNLQTLMLQQNWCMNAISESFFQFMPAIQVLDLSRTDIREVPMGITKLVMLRHLDLSHTNITKFPLYSSELTQLQYLNLSHTRITELPEEVGVLAKLKHLTLHHTDSLRWTWNC